MINVDIGEKVEVKGYGYIVLSVVEDKIVLRQCKRPKATQKTVLELVKQVLAKESIFRFVDEALDSLDWGES